MLVTHSHARSGWGVMAVSAIDDAEAHSATTRPQIGIMLSRRLTGLVQAKDVSASVCSEASLDTVNKLR